MGLSITSANAIIVLTVPGVVPGIQLEGFSADDIYDMEAIEVAETSMGVDGVLSAGFVFAAVKQSFSFQADSPSIQLFEDWYTAELALVDKIPAVVLVTLPSLGIVYTQQPGWFKSYPPAPSAGKTLKPRKFGLEFGRCIPSGL